MITKGLKQCHSHSTFRMLYEARSSVKGDSTFGTHQRLGLGALLFREKDQAPVMGRSSSERKALNQDTIVHPELPY